MGSTRREFLKRSLAAGSLVLLPGLKARAAQRTWEDPHFFLLITVPNPSGLDPSYLFDSRPLAMTQAGLIQNFRGKEPVAWQGSNGVRTWATELVKPLEAHRQNFSVVNGVVMAAAFDGHDQNFNHLFTGDAFGGESFVPHLNLPGPSHRPLDGIQRGALKATLTNTGWTVPLTPTTGAALVSSLRAVPALDPNSKLFQYLSSRMRIPGTGGFSLGAAAMQAAFAQAPALARMLGGLSIQGEDDVPGFVSMMGQFFRSGATGAAILVLDVPDSALDTHDVGSASRQPEVYASIANQLAQTFQLLKSTPYDSGRSLLDVTTFLFSAEFGRTMKQAGKSVDLTGTDHNPFGNSILIGGKGIRGGQVLGSTDSAAVGEALSPAHLVIDSSKVKAIGRPFDFVSGVSRPELPAEFRVGDYLGFNSLVNTVYSAFGVGLERWRHLERNGPLAPVVSQLLA